MNPWICPRCNIVNGPTTAACANPSCENRRNIFTTGTTPRAPMLDPFGPPYYEVRDPVPPIGPTCYVGDTIPPLYTTTRS